MPDWCSPRWKAHALAAISEGLCPEHRVPLGADVGGARLHFGHAGTGEPVTPGGWCASCRTWWQADIAEQVVIATYALPERGEW